MLLAVGAPLRACLPSRVLARSQKASRSHALVRGRTAGRLSVARLSGPVAREGGGAGVQDRPDTIVPGRESEFDLE